MSIDDSSPRPGRPAGRAGTVLPAVAAAPPKALAFAGEASAGESGRKPVRSNRDRTEATREALIAAARARFVTDGFGATSTPAIVADAGVTRGALYHHFEDKRALFQAVVEREAEAVAGRIASVGADCPLSPREALFEGSKAYLEAMRVPGRTRLLLIDAPAVLGPGDAHRVDDRHAGATLAAALARVLGREGPDAGATGKAGASNRAGGNVALPLAATATLLSAAFDRAALAIDAGQDADEISAAMLGLVEGVIVLASRR